HVHFGHDALRLRPLLRARHRPTFVVTFHGADANVLPRVYGKDMYRELFELADRFTANSLFLKGQLVHLGCSPDDIDIVPMGVDVNATPLLLRTHQGEPVRLLSVGRLVKAKGFDCSIRAVRRLLDAGLDLEYEIVGAGEERAALDSLIRELALSGRVRLLGAKRDHEVSQLYQRAHLF